MTFCIATHQPQFLPWIGYYHKMITADRFVYMQKAQYNNRDYQNRAKLNGNWLTIPLKKASRETKICDRYPVAGWNSPNSKLMKSLYQYEKSPQCLYPSRISHLRKVLARIDEDANLGAINCNLDYNLVLQIKQLIRSNLLVMPMCTLQRSVPSGDTPTERLVTILEEVKPRYEAVTSLIGSGAYNGYYEKDKLPDWVRRSKVQVRVVPDVITESIIRVLGEIEDPYNYILDSFEWKAI